MRHHFDTRINLKDLILTYRPATIVEMGAIRGENTVNLLKLREIYPFMMVTIDDGSVDNCFYEVKEAHFRASDDYYWIQGISFEKLDVLVDKTAEFVIIDTDHNYWTLKKELKALYPKLHPRAIIVLHDTVSSLANPIVMEQKEYKNGDPYPLKDIIDAGHTMNDAIDEFMTKDHPGEWNNLRMSNESGGALAICRGISL